jgi:hypothetical protein
VSGVGIEKDAGEYVLTVHLDSDSAEVDKDLPDEIDGVPVKYLRSGPFRKF